MRVGLEWDVIKCCVGGQYLSQYNVEIKGLLGFGWHREYLTFWTKDFSVDKTQGIRDTVGQTYASEKSCP